MARTIVISNRVMDPGKAAQAGGVAVALADVVDRTGGLWIGWDGRISSDVPEAPASSRRRRRSTTITTPLSEEEHHGFYLGYSNSVLWPVFHNRLDLAQFEAGYFRTYREVNARFARLIAPLVGPDDVIWVHDYQFLLLGLELRKLGLENPIGFFLHIPFPPAQSFLSVPEHRELARGLAAYGLVGLQTSADVANLLSYLQHVDGRLLPDGRIRAFERILSVGRFPIGIAPSDFDRPIIEQPLVQGAAGIKRVIGVDRLDYSKGLPQKFRAFGRFLEIAPQFRRQIVLTQIAPPTRESVEAYSDIRKELEALSGSINGRFGELDWVPIHYIHRSVPRARLPGICRSSRIGLVTPLRDGMNLVAKEFVAAQDRDDPGVLILSQFAGAAEEMCAALIVNPYNIEEVAQALLTAIEMPLDERLARQESLLEVVRSHDVMSWSDAFLGELSRLGREPAAPLSADHADRIAVALTRIGVSPTVEATPAARAATTSGAAQKRPLRRLA